jgi:hypothetical protein
MALKTYSWNTFWYVVFFLRRYSLLHEVWCQLWHLWSTALLPAVNRRIWVSQIPYLTPNLELTFKFLFLCFTTLQYGDKKTRTKFEDLNAMKFLYYSWFPKRRCVSADPTVFPFVSLIRPTCKAKRLQSFGRMIVTEKPEVLLCSPQI